MNLVNAMEVVVNGLTDSLFVWLPTIRSASAACIRSARYAFRPDLPVTFKFPYLLYYKISQP